MSEKIKDFYELDAWKKAHSFVMEIYKITKRFPKEELYGLTSQLRRAAYSITANIAEGFSRYHYNDKIRFYHNARGSISEVQNFLYLAKDLLFLTDKEFEYLFEESKEISKLINGLIRSIEKQK
jgi:four helix bundle protein